MVCNTAHFFPVMVYEACAFMRVSAVPVKLKLLIGKDILKVLEARFDLKLTAVFFSVLETFKEWSCKKVGLDILWYFC